MKATAEKYIFSRGKCGSKYLRRRIPRALRPAYPDGRSEIVLCLGTSDPRLAASRAIFALAKIEQEFLDKKAAMDLSHASLRPTRVSKLTDNELTAVGAFWSHQVLAQDESQRQRGLDDEEFDALGQKLTGQHAELRRMLAQGRTLPVLPALKSFLHLCGLEFDPADTEHAKRASRAFIESLVSTLAYQLRRQDGESVETESVVPAGTHPLHVVVPQLAPKAEATWEAAFAAWRDYAESRPKSTVIAYQTPWTDLRLFAAKSGVTSPEAVTPKLMSEFVTDLRSRSLAVRTINERLNKIRSIYKIACSRFIVTHNPAAQTLGVKASSVRQRQKRRLPFDSRDLKLIFGSAIYTQHKRSQGQSGEASYWIPLLMFYTGARPEEIAGLALNDLREHPKLGWFLSFVDRPSSEDQELFETDLDRVEDVEVDASERAEEHSDESFFLQIPDSHRRTLKNAPSIRRVPVAQELIDLGLLRYVEWLREEGHAVFFPTLVKDWHGKLSGSFGKFFGRYIRDIGILDPRKVLYSFRHTMKDFLEEAGAPSKYLKRVLGHTSGDGHVTDGYGSDLPWRRVVKHFRRIAFPAISALPWQPGTGSFSLKRKA